MMAPVYPTVQKPARILPIILALFEQFNKFTINPKVYVDKQPAKT